MLTSPGNLRFWAALCGCSRGDAGLAAVAADFERAAAAGKPQLQDFCREWNADLLRRVTLLAVTCFACPLPHGMQMGHFSCARMHCDSGCDGGEQDCHEPGYEFEIARQVRELPGVSGVHVMPLTKAARSLALELLS